MQFDFSPRAARTLIDGLDLLYYEACRDADERAAENIVGLQEYIERRLSQPHINFHPAHPTARY